MSKLSHWLYGDKRKADKLAQTQLGLYQQQTATLKAENAKLEGERVVKKKKLARKQIKSLRSAFRAPGFMGSGGDGSDYANSLGE